MRAKFVGNAFAAATVSGLRGIQMSANAQQPPQRVGSQAFHLMDLLLVDGGRYVDQDAAILDQVPEFLSANLTLGFISPPGPVMHASPRSPDAPVVSNGFIWSNLVDRAWLFGGRPLHENPLHVVQNDLWRFEMGDGGVQWTQLDAGNNVTKGRPSHGAGCSVPDLQRGYYLGGMTRTGGDTATEAPATYLHLLTVFDMQKETLSTIAIPDFVPIINQSLVFLNTATRRGALVALGGYVEKNGTLSLAQMSSIYVFDVESEQWSVQPVTDLDGHAVDPVEQSDGKNLDAPETFPSRRMSACAAAGSSQDRTSHNIVLIGGQNNATALADAWVLSLPSAVWIRAQTNPDFAPNYPSAESSCILLNSRFLVMFGGCLLDVNTHKPCMSYSSGPLNYDISLLRPADYAYDVVGYLVPEGVSKVIGGNTTGFANHSKPMFTNFSDPLLEELFTPPYGTWLYGPFLYEPLVEIVMIVLLLAPFLTLLPSVSLKLFKRPGVLGKKAQNADWRPWTFSHTYLAFVACTTVCLAALVAFLQWRSQQPDPLFEHWPGGSVSSGTWTGEPFNSTFIRSPTLDRPPQGLLSFYYNSQPDGLFSQKNGAQRLGRGVYWTFTFLPMLLAVLYGRMWKALDDEVKRIDMYHRLQKPRGTTGARSLCLNYHMFWAPLSIFQALRYRHCAVAVSSLGSVLATIVIPVFSNYVFYWEVYDGAALDRPATYSWQVALVDHDWAYRLVGALAAAQVCCVVLFFLLPSQKTGLSRDMRGIADLAYLLEGTDARVFDLPLDSSGWSLSEMEGLFATSRFRLIWDKDDYRLEKTTAVPGTASASDTSWWSQAILLVTRHKTVTVIRKWLRPLAEFCQAAARTCSRAVQKIVGDGSNFFPFRRLVFLSWLISLFLVMFAVGWITASLNKNAKNEEWNYGIPIDPNVYLIVGIVIQSIVDVIDHAVRSLAPFHALAQGYQRPDVLWADYSSGIPVWEAWIACRDGHYLVCSSMLASLAITVFTIFLGSLQLSASSYGSTTFESDLAAATASTLLLAFALAVHLVLGYHFSWPKRVFLPRAPAHAAAVIPYVICSSSLRADLKRVVGRSSTRGKIQSLDNLDARYGFGKVGGGGGTEHYRIERHHDEAGALTLVA